MNFKNFLLDEDFTFRTDASNPSDVGREAVRAARIAKQNPRRHMRQNALKAQKDAENARQSDSPTKQLDIQITNLQKQLENLKLRRQNVRDRSR